MIGKLIKKIKGLFKKEEKVKLEEKVEKRFIATASQHGASGQMAKMAVQYKRGSTKVYGWAGMYDWLRQAWNLPPMDLTFGRDEPVEEFEVVSKGTLKVRK